MAAGAIFGLAGGIMQAMAAKSSADYNEEIARENARASRMEARAQAGQSLDEFRQLRGEQAAMMAKSGADPSSGSFANIRLDTAKKEQLQFQTDLWRGETQAVRYQNEAEQHKAQGKAAMAQGIIGGIGSLVGGLSGMGQGSPVSLGASQGPAPYVSPFYRAGPINPFLGIGYR